MKVVLAPALLTSTPLTVALAVVASTVPVSSLPPCATTQSDGARERTEKLNSHQRTRYTHRPHLPRPLLIA